MKTKIGLLLLVPLLAWLAPQPVRAQGTAFTYQGRLNTTNGVANGSYDFTFAVFDTGSGGAAGSGTITNVAVAVSNGLFTTTLDFGSAPDGAPAWLEIGVRPSSSNPGAFTALVPRQAVLPTPYAMFATTASNLVGTVPLAQLPAAVVTNGAGGVNLIGTFTGHGAGVTNVNAATLNGLGAGNFWQLGGNTVSPGQFLGSTNNLPLELRVNNVRALRIEPNTNGAPNMIGGSSLNFVGAGIVGATIGGGGAGNYFGFAYTNRVEADFGTVSGGYVNTIQPYANSATISGGDFNTIQPYASHATISGGDFNTIQTTATSATIGGGQANTIRTDVAFATIGGGQQNTIQTYASYATISGGRQNTIQTYAESTTIGGGGQNMIQIDADAATIGGGLSNTIQTNAAFATISGGHFSTIQTNAPYATIGGGGDNTIQSGADAATISGGSNNLVAAGSYQSTIGGGDQNSIGTNSYGSTVGGGQNNVISNNATDSTIGGGLANLASGNASTVAGGARNKATGRSATVGGGGDQADVFSPGNYASGDYATVGGGIRNRASGFHSTVGGGNANLASGWTAIVAGGFQNYATNSFATVPGGDYNLAGGANSFAAGHRAKAINTGAFVWADSQDADFSSTAANQFLVRAAGGVGINTSNPVVSLTVQGSGAYNAIGAAAIAVKNSTANKTWEWHVLDDGRMQFADLTAGATRMLIDTNGNVSATSFNPTSDRHAKENFAAVSAQEILAKVAALPITRWNFKQETGTPHIGPMAQDFHAAFGTGTDDRHIATVDADGVALAAIQGLNQKLEAQTAAARRKDAEIAELKTRLEKLEQLMNLKAGAAR